MIADEEVRQALRRQWARIAEACEHLDQEQPSRVDGWRNAEVLAHLAIQPVLLARFLSGAGPLRPGDTRLADDLAGTRTPARPSMPVLGMARARAESPARATPPALTRRS